MQPAISVILPVYNAAAYLRLAIESILQQHFTNFELIIINDAATDESDKIIRSYTDHRIIYHVQPENKGVVAAMNLGLSLCRAPYVCIMHADDISMPNRLELQKKWLDEHPETAVVAGWTTLINEKGIPCGEWELDRTTHTRKAIRARMKQENCITHPTVMMRTDIVKRYGYDARQQLKGYAVEDYPLWLNLLSDGEQIDKIPKVILQYRVHTASATGTFLKRKNPFLVNYHTKKIYLESRSEGKRLNGFDRQVWATMYVDWIKAGLKELKALLK